MTAVALQLTRSYQVWTHFCTIIFAHRSFGHNRSVHLLQSRSIGLRIYLRWFVFTQSTASHLVRFCSIRSRSFASSFLHNQIMQFFWFFFTRPGHTVLLVHLHLIMSHISAGLFALDQVAHYFLLIPAFCSFLHSIMFVFAQSIVHQHLSPRLLDNSFPLFVCQHRPIPSIVCSTFCSYANKFLLDQQVACLPLLGGSLLVCHFGEQSRFANFASSLICTHFLLVLSAPFLVILLAQSPPLFGLFGLLPSACLLQLIPLNAEYYEYYVRTLPDAAAYLFEW